MMVRRKSLLIACQVWAPCCPKRHHMHSLGTLPRDHGGVDQLLKIFHRVRLHGGCDVQLTCCTAGLQRSAIKALCHMSYVDGASVLPIIMQRFQAALVTATAMHQLSASITTLAQCVRPMLLCQWGHQDEDAAQMIAEAMMALTAGKSCSDVHRGAAQGCGSYEG